MLVCGHTCTVHPISVHINLHIVRVIPRKSMKNKLCSLLLSLDISAAFDMLDFDTLLSRLHSDFGIAGIASTWLHCYLTDRQCYVAGFGNSRSDTWICYEGVPQGSMLGPLMFSSYVSPIARLTASTSAIISMLTIPSFTLQYGRQKTRLGYSVTRWFLINGLARPRRSHLARDSSLPSV